MKKRVIHLLAFPALVLALVAVAVPGSTGARAAPGQTHVLGTKQHARHFSGNGNLLYNGGPVMKGTQQAYAIFWEPTGSFVSAMYNSLLKRYFNDIGSSGLYHNNVQYMDSGGHFPGNSVLAGWWVDTHPYPGNPIFDFQVRGEVSHAMSVNHWHASIDNIFFVFTARNENICINNFTCSFTTFCAYHGFFGANTIYAAMPYTGTNLSACGVTSSPNRDFSADSTVNVTSHEQNEAATDPLLNAWFDSSGMEIGDKCAWIFGPLNAHGGDVTWHTHSYMVQKEWDNHVSRCVLKGP